MKSEPDRLDFLIVLLPLILVGLLGFQAYEYIQMKHQRSSASPVNRKERVAPGNPGGPPASASGAEPRSPDVAPEGDGSTGAGPVGAEAQPTTEDLQAGGGDVGEAAPQDADVLDTDAPVGEPIPDAGEPPVVDAEQAPAPGESADQGAAPPQDQPEPDVANGGQPAAAAEIDADVQVADAQPEEPSGGEVPDAEPPANDLDAVEPLPPADAADGGVDAASAATAPEADHAEVLINPQENPAKVGELLAVDVLMRGASEAAGVIFHLRYTRNMLQINDDPQSEPGPFFDGPAAQFNVTALPNGKVVVSIKDAEGKGRSGDGRLATFFFKVLAPGEARLELLQALVLDEENQPLPAIFTAAPLIIVE